MISENVSFPDYSFQSFSQYENTVVIAQSVDDPEVLQQMQDAWNNFVESGQIWALLIGFFLGYMLRTFIS